MKAKTIILSAALVIGVGLTALAVPSLSAAETADIIYHNGTIITIDDAAGSRERAGDRPGMIDPVHPQRTP